MEHRIIAVCDGTDIKIYGEYRHSGEWTQTAENKITGEGVTHLGIQILDNGSILYYKKKGANAPKEQFSIDEAGMPNTYKVVCHILPKY